MRPVTDLQRKVAPFEVISEYQPSGDQPTAIEDIVRRVKGGEHVLEQVAAVGVRGHGPAADGDLSRLRRGERLRLLAAAAVGVDERQRDGERDLEAEHPEHRTAQRQPRLRFPALRPRPPHDAEPIR